MSTAYSVLRSLLEMGLVAAAVAYLSLIIILPVDPVLRRRLIGALLLGVAAVIVSITGVVLLGVLSLFRS